ncbi:MAG: RHS repeat-associated core domain-containing protein, partial [Candidatus Micrarchaeaceae archaeon]
KAPCERAGRRFGAYLVPSGPARRPESGMSRREGPRQSPARRPEARPAGPNGGVGGRAPENVVEWSGEDSTSGLAAYDVQVQVDGGAWQDWRVGVTETSGVYVGILGHTYAFRSRGHDRAGNVEAWPDTPDAETKVVARVRKTYIFGGMPVAVRLLAQGEAAGLVVYLHLDHLGSPVVATDGGGDVVAEVRHYPYGGMRYQVGEMPTTLNFTGQRLDAGVGLLYYRARYYDPVLGRFVQPDTVVPDENKQVALTPLLVGAFEPGLIAQVGEENREVAQYGFWFQRGEQARAQTKHPRGPVSPQRLNRYTYCLGNPLRHVDKNGHFLITLDQAYALRDYINFLLGYYRPISFVEDVAYNIVLGGLPVLLDALLGATVHGVNREITSNLEAVLNELDKAIAFARGVASGGDTPTIDMRIIRASHRGVTFCYVTFTVTNKERFLALYQMYGGDDIRFRMAVFDPSEPAQDIYGTYFGWYPGADVLLRILSNLGIDWEVWTW